MRPPKHERTPGRKWTTQRLPSLLVLALRQLAAQDAISPADAVALALRTVYKERFDRALNPWRALDAQTPDLFAVAGLTTKETPTNAK